MTIDEATTGLIEAITETDTGELLALAAMLAEASANASERRGTPERVFAAFGPLLGALLSERYKETTS